MSNFYLTLPSNASQVTFPKNTPNEYKVKLPAPLQLPGHDWEVALASISFPDSQAVLNEKKVGKFPMVMSTDVEKTKDPPPPSGQDPKTKHHIIKYARQKLLLQADVPVQDGITFWKKLIDALQQDFYTDLLPNEEWTDVDGHKGIPEFKFVNRGGHYDLHIDNSLLHGFSQHNWIDIDVNLAFAFKLIRQVKHDGMTKSNDLLDQGDIFLGESMQLVHTQIPKLPNPKKYGIENLKSEPVFWDIKKVKYTTETEFHYVLRLYGLCNWNITDIEHNFEVAFGELTRTLFVYSDVVVPQVVGGTQTHMIREVVYDSRKRGRARFEPQHLQFLPVRMNWLDTIEVGITENDGTPLNLQGGNTVVTLFFQKKK